MEEHKHNKKPLNIGALAMVFVTISIIFCSLSYAYGMDKGYKEANKWYQNEENFIKFASSMDYSVLKKEPYVPQVNVGINVFNNTDNVVIT